MKHSLSKKACLLVISILILHLLAYQFYWYASMWWFDMLMHTLGGVFLGLIGGVLLSRYISSAHTATIFGTILLFVFIVGFGWEVFEYVVQALIKTTSIANIPDSISDLLCDLSGGVISIYFVLRAKKRYNTGNANSNQQ